MAVQTEAKSGGRPFLHLVIGVMLVGLVVFVVARVDFLIDKISWFNPLVPFTLPVILIVLTLVGIAFWVHGHRVYAKNKGIPTVAGLILGFVPIIGLLILMLVPTKPRPRAAVGAAAESDEPEEVDESRPA